MATIDSSVATTVVHGQEKIRKPTKEWKNPAHKTRQRRLSEVQPTDRQKKEENCTEKSKAKNITKRNEQKGRMLQQKVAEKARNCETTRCWYHLLHVLRLATKTKKNSNPDTVDR